jgi:hypothetical protein
MLDLVLVPRSTIGCCFVVRREWKTHTAMVSAFCSIVVRGATLYLDRKKLKNSRGIPQDILTELDRCLMSQGTYSGYSTTWT